MKNSNWYVSIDGKATGPSTTEQILHSLSLGKLNTSDLIFREGEDKWKAISDFTDFEGATPIRNENSDQKWVLLVRNLEDTQPGRPRFDQSGPFSKENILEKIKTGEAKWTDHVWQKGMSKWQRLSDVDEFNPKSTTSLFQLQRTMQEEITHAGVDEKAELLASVYVSPIKPQPQILDSMRPPEAIGENLATAVASEISKEVTAVNYVQPSTHVKPQGQSVEEETGSVTKTEDPIQSEEKTESKAKKNKMVFKKMHLYAATLSLMGIVVLVSLLMNEPKAPVEITKVEKTVPVQQENVQAQQPVENRAPAKTENPPAPKFLKVIALKTETNNPQLVIENNASPGEAITVKVSGKEGQILEYVRFEKQSQVARQANEVPTLDLTNWALPQGSYFVEASVGDVSASTQIFIGQKNRQFQTKLEKHKKLLASKKNNEIKELKTGLADIQKLNVSLAKQYTKLKNKPTQWNGFYKSWSKDVAGLNKGILKKYKSSAKDRFVMFKQIEETRAVANDLFKSGRGLNEAVRNKRAPASGSHDQNRIKKNVDSIMADLK